MYSPSMCADTGKYACQYGIVAAASLFSKKLGYKVSIPTDHSMKKAYLEGMREKRKALDEGDVTTLPSKKCGRSFMLRKELDHKVQMYVQKVRDGGGVVTGRIAVAAVRGMMLSSDKSKLAEFGGHIKLINQYAYSLLKGIHLSKKGLYQIIFFS